MTNERDISNADLLAAIQRIEAEVAALRADLKAQRIEATPSEVLLVAAIRKHFQSRPFVSPEAFKSTPARVLENAGITSPRSLGKRLARLELHRCQCGAWFVNRTGHEEAGALWRIVPAAGFETQPNSGTPLSPSPRGS